MNDAAMEFYCDVLEGLVELWFVHRRISIRVFPEFGRWNKDRTIRYRSVPYNVKLYNRRKLQKYINE
jgi:Ni/Co efflux regulator RcnB